MFLELLQDLLYGFHVWLAKMLDIDQNVMQLHHYKHIKLLSKDLVDVVLKTS